MKNITQHNLDEWLFEYFEGNLNEEDSNRLLREIGNNPEFAEELNYWKHSYIKDYPSVQYSSPRKLKKRSTGKIYWISAGMLLLAGLFFLYTHSTKDTSHDSTLIVPNESQKASPIPDIINEASGKKIIYDKAKPEESRTIKENHKTLLSKKPILSPDVEIQKSEISDNNPVIKDSVIKQEIVPSYQQPAIKTEPETEVSPVNKELEEKPVSKPKVKKNPLKNLHLKPGEEINKMNSDF